VSREAVTARNRSLGYVLASVVVLMVGLAYASVPLYDLFCRVTGYGGTTQRADAAPSAAAARTMTVRFNADVDPNLPWRFYPVVNAVNVHVGEEKLAFFQAVNDASVPVTGTAVFNVTPQKAGAYFNKIQCFCFDKQVLQPGQTMDFPVSFFVDPDIASDPNLDDVKTITLSYTFFTAREADAPRAALQN
jgi:cytochrome c oxidase assembly protein subunit 11